MKISIPAFLSSTLIVFLIGVSIYFWVNYFEISHISEFPNKITFFLWLIYLVGPITILFLVKRFKIIFLENDFLIVVYPFLFKKNRFNFSDIKKVDWSIYGGGRSAEFLRMNITFKSGNLLSISDLEYEKFTTIEKEILQFVKPNSSFSWRSELLKSQAKFNIFYCVLGLVFFGFIIGILIKNVFKDELIIITVLIILVLMFTRILFHTFRYLKILKS